jgi:hypothetical protein
MDAAFLIAASKAQTANRGNQKIWRELDVAGLTAA